VYSSIYMSGQGDTPYRLLASTGAVTVTGTGVMSGSISYKLNSNTQYWCSVVFSGTPSVYTLDSVVAGPWFGCNYTGRTGNSFVYTDSADSILPATINTASFIDGGLVGCPALIFGVIIP
jgi:hypothetical protein